MLLKVLKCVQGTAVLPSDEQSLLAENYYAIAINLYASLSVCKNP